VRISTRRGTTRLRLDETESGVLGSLIQDMSEALDQLAEDDPVRARLFPAGYRDDDTAAADFRTMTESALLTQRLERLDQCRAEVLSDADISLDGEGLERWLMMLNDLRLALGTRLDVREDDVPSFDPDDPQTQPRQVYYWLTALQDRLVGEAMKPHRSGS
jgi:hypothetical protein